MAEIRHQKKHLAAQAGRIRVGIGGWTYDPWCKTFYPADLPKTKHLHYASRAMGVIEINSTFYGAQKPTTFAKWRDQTPEHFIFSVKAPRSITYSRSFQQSKAGVERFIDGGLAELGVKLGPILWQFPDTRKFDADQFESFLSLLPRRSGSQSLRHALDVRHPSFATGEFTQMADRFGVAVVVSDVDPVPDQPDSKARFVYARLRAAQSRFKAGYSPSALRKWAETARLWCIDAESQAGSRDVFVFFINGAKERAPAAAGRLIELLDLAD